MPEYINKYQATIFIVFFLLLSGCSGMPRIESGSVEIENENIHMKIGFNDHDIRTIREYYGRKGKKPKGLPPGLAKKDRLPPGLQKQLERNGKLPPGLEKRMLPDELERRLTVLPSRYVRLKIGGDVVLMNQETSIVIDIIYNVE